MYYVYILKSRKDGWHYTGMTNNLERRIAQHNAGDIATPSTMNRGPFDLIFCEIVKDRVEARQREKYFKSGAGRRFLKNKIIDKNIMRL